jgi:hypothetical protein
MRSVIEPTCTACASTAFRRLFEGFSNCFIESVAQSGFTVNFPDLIDTQCRHVAWAIAWVLLHVAAELEATVRRRTSLGRRGRATLQRHSRTT